MVCYGVGGPHRQRGAWARRIVSGALSAVFLMLAASAVRAEDPGNAGGASGPPGQLAGRGAIGASGQLTLSYPLGAVSVDYDSAAGQWSVGGAHAIRRSLRFGAPSWALTDVFALDGEELVCISSNCSSTTDTGTREYVTRNQSFARIKYMSPGAKSADGKPASYWVVEGKDGNRSIYGWADQDGQFSTLNPAFGGVLQRTYCEGTNLLQNSDPMVCMINQDTTGQGDAAHPAGWMLAATIDPGSGSITTYAYSNRPVPLQSDTADVPRALLSAGGGYLQLVEIATRKKDAVAGTGAISVTRLAYEFADERFHHSSYRGDTFSGTRHRVTSVTSYVGGAAWDSSLIVAPSDAQATRRFELVWDDREPVLTGIDVLARSGSAWVGLTSREPTIGFEYEASPTAFLDTAKGPQVLIEGFSAIQYTEPSTGRTLASVLDVNGDNLPDWLANEAQSGVGEVNGGSNVAMAVRYNRGGSFGPWEYFHQATSIGMVRSSSSGKVDFDTIDVDGDGLVDLVNKRDNNDLYVAYNDGSGGANPYPGWKLFHEYGSSSYVRQASTSDGSTLWDSRDLNGDGVADLLMAESYSEIGNVSTGNTTTYDIAARIGRGSRGSNSSAFGAMFEAIPGSSAMPARIERTTASGHTTQALVDVNGDGLPDLLGSGAVVGSATDANNVLVKYGTGHGFTALWTTFIYRGSYDWMTGDPNVRFGNDDAGVDTQDWRDVDGDGNLDLIFPESKGNGWLCGSSAGCDANGDGDQNDLLVAWGAAYGLAASPVWQWAWQDGEIEVLMDDDALRSAGVAVSGQVPISKALADGRQVWQLVDVNADGALDLVLSGSELSAPTSDVHVIWGRPRSTARLTKVTDPAGGVTEYEYALLDRGPVSANPGYPHSGWVLARKTAEDGFGGTQTTAYAYENGYFDRAEHLDRGFGKVTVTSVEDGTKEVTEYLQSGTFAGQVRRTTSYDARGYVQEANLFEYEDLCGGGDSEGRSTLIHGTVTGMYGCGKSQAYASYPAHAAGTLSVRFPALVRVDRLSIDGRATALKDGVPVGTTDFVRRRTEARYDPYGNESTVTDFGVVDSASGADTGLDKLVTQTTWTADATNWVFSPAVVQSFALDGSGQQVQTGLTKLTFQAGSVLVTKRQEYATSPSSSTDAGLVTTWSYDSSGNVISTTDPAGTTTTTTYDSTYRALPTRVDRTATVLGGARVFAETREYDDLMRLAVDRDANGLARRYSYDSFGRRVQVEEADGTATPSSWLAMQTATYDADGVLPEVTLVRTRDSSSDSYRSEYVYRDGLGREVARQVERGAGNASAAKYVTFFRWYQAVDSDSDSHVETKVSEWTDPAFEPVLAWGDRPSRPVGPDGLAGVTSRTSYWKPDSSSVGSGRWFVTSTSPSGSSSEQSAFRVGSQQWMVDIDAAGIRTETYSDPATRTFAVRELDAAGKTLTTVVTESPGTTETVDASSNVTTEQFDWLGRVTSLRDPDLGLTTYAYSSASGLLASRTDAKGQVTTFGYDGFGRPVTELRADGAVATTYYDGDDDGDGAIDATRTNAKLQGYGSKHVVGSVVTSLEGNNAWGMPAAVSRVAGAGSARLALAYDSLQRVSQVTYPGLSSPVTFAYDSATQALVRVTHPTLGALLSTTAQDDWGRPTSVTYGNGKTRTFTYGSETTDYRVRTVDDPDVGADANTLSYTFDAVGRLTQLASSSGQFDRTYSYDSQQRLTQVTATSGAVPSERFAYDAIGNLASKAEGTATAAYGYGNNPAPSTKAAPKHAPVSYGDWRYAYDANGNMIARRKRAAGATSGEAWSDGQRLGYDAVNQLSGVTSGLHPWATGYWSFFEGAGTSAADVVAGVDATLTGKPAWVESGIAGPALSVDGVDDSITTANASNQPSGNSARTLAAWVKVQNLTDLASDGKGAVVAYGGLSSDYVALALRPDGNLTFVGGTNTASSSGTKVRNGEWTHVAVTYATTKAVAFYVNGEAAGTATLPSVMDTSSSGPVTIGCLRAADHCLKNVALDEVGIFGRALGADEIAGLASLAASGAVGAWRLDDGAGSAAGGVTASTTDSGHYGAATAVSDATMPSWTPGAVGGAADFDGADDALLVAGGPAALNANDFTASAWMRIDGFRGDGGDMRVVSDDANGAGWSLAVRGASDATSTVRLVTRGASSTFLDSPAAAVKVGRWHHLAAVVDKGTSTTSRKLYVDGTLVASDTVSGTATSDAGPVSIGAGFNGRIDEVELDDRAVASVVVQAKAARSPKGASHFWALSESDGTTTADEGNAASSAALLVGGASRELGTIGGGLRFDGVDGEVQTNAALTGSFGKLTVAAFVQTTDAPSNWNANMAIVDYSRYEHFTLFLDDAGYPRFYTVASNGTKNECKVTSTTSGATKLNDGKRHHVAATYDGVDKKIYVDGQWISTCANAHSGLPIGTTAATAGLIGAGRSTSTGYSHFDGSIDEVWLDVDRALTASQVAALAHRSQNVQMQYDASGERVVKSVDGLKTITYFPAYEVRGGTEVRHYDEASAIEIGGALSWTHRDHLGSPSTTTDSVGATTRERTFSAYGEPAQDEALVATAPVTGVGFAGGVSDDETGLVYFGARYYDPVLARFVSADSEYDAGVIGLNRYAYAGDDPVGFNDPTGHRRHVPDGWFRDSAGVVLKGTSRTVRDPEFRAAFGVAFYWSAIAVTTLAAPPSAAEMFAGAVIGFGTSLAFDGSDGKVSNDDLENAGIHAGIGALTFSRPKGEFGQRLVLEGARSGAAAGAFETTSYFATGDPIDLSAVVTGVAAGFAGESAVTFGENALARAALGAAESKSASRGWLFAVGDGAGRLRVANEVNTVNTMSRVEVVPTSRIAGQASARTGRVPLSRQVGIRHVRDLTWSSRVRLRLTYDAGPWLARRLLIGAGGAASRGTVKGIGWAFTQF